MTSEEQSLLAEWQANRHLPPTVRLEEDYDAMLSIVDFAMNIPDDLQAAE